MEDCMKVDDILVDWVIPTFDRQLKGPFPLPQRYYVLDWTKALRDEQAEIMKILGISDATKEQKSARTWTESATWSVGAAKSDERMLRFRHMFIEKSIEEFKRLTSDAGKSFRTFKGFCLPDYFEDETGRAISMQEMMQIATGDKNTILFDAENMVKIGPCPICSKETWTVDKANTVFNLIQVVRLIWRSSWARKRSSVTTYRKNKTESLVECDFPTVENMSAVLTLFRQLYAPSDKLVEKVCEVYKEHSSNTTKKMWVDFCLKNFRQSLDRNSNFIHLQRYTVRQLFEAFLYGTGMVHSPSDRNHKNRNRLSDLVRQHSREKVIMAVNESFWSVFGYAVDVFHVVNQDYEYWTEQEGCAKSDMFDIYSLLQSNISR